MNRRDEMVIRRIWIVPIIDCRLMKCRSVRRDHQVALLVITARGTHRIIERLCVIRNNLEVFRPTCPIFATDLSTLGPGIALRLAHLVKGFENESLIVILKDTGNLAPKIRENLFCLLLVFSINRQPRPRPPIVAAIMMNINNCDEILCQAPINDLLHAQEKGSFNL